MKLNRTFFWALIALVVVAALYRIIPNRPAGFAPQIAMALFGGAIVKDKKWAFMLPLFSMFISDVLYQVLYNLNMTDIKGFYGMGQFTNYVLFAGITVMGFMINKNSVKNILTLSIVAPTAYFLVSNGLVWLAGGPNAINVLNSQPLTRDLTGLIQTYMQGIPFYKGSLMATVCFSIILFGGYYMLTKKNSSLAHQ